MKFAIVFVGLFAISNAAVVLRSGPSPLIVKSAIVPSVIPAIPSVDLSEWEAYKEKFGKSYIDVVEDRFRRNIYFANKEKVAKYDELFALGLTGEKLALDSFADWTRDEQFRLRSIVEDAEEEWNGFKILYGKLYDDFEDRFRKTVYFIKKDFIKAHNMLAEHGFSSVVLSIDTLSDVFHDELPEHAWKLPAVAVARYGYPSLTGYPLETGYPSLTGYPLETGYPSLTGYPLESGYPLDYGYPYGRVLKIVK